MFKFIPWQTAMVGPWHFTTFSLRNDIRMMFAQRLEDIWVWQTPKSRKLIKYLFVSASVGWQLFDKCRNLHPPTHGELSVSTEHMCDRAIGGGRRRGGHPGREKELYFAKDSMVWVCTRRPHLFYYLRICRGGWVVGGTAASSGHYTNKCQYLFMPEISQTH